MIFILDMNKLFCTFCQKENIDEILNNIVDIYTILYNKIFILEIENSFEFVCTYNVDNFNINNNYIIPNTILTHRKKETNTLYTINALNKLISSLNNGRVDKNYPINWSDYANSILLTRKSEFVKINTKVNRIFVLK